MAESEDARAWADALAAFDTWAELADDARAAWLASMAADRPALHARLLSLIAADRDAEDRSFLSADAQAAPQAAADLAGRRLGPWLVERLIGSGGMGQVWLARRTDGLYEGLAAIKLMRLSVADAAANARFAREGQLLGRLSHPHIARLLDAGVTGAGERYLVLEYVDGERIDRWCDAKRLTVRQRIALFTTVCAAVAHAHENLVVHRDLKPSNIFVTREGEVKLLDFGVAKLLDAEALDCGDASELTRSGGAAMTPDYASPEQLSGGAVTTATDVYGLGLVLYALLGGQRPFDPRSASGPPAPPFAVAARGEPRPLWALPDDAEAAQRIAAARSATPAALRQALRSDVAIAIGKAIKADPAERYRSVPEFADDLQRTLEQRPISARADSLAYRGTRFVRRHGFGVGAAALILIAVAGGVTGTLIKAREAERQAERAVAVKRFLLDLFDQARTAVTSNGVQKREATIGDILNAGAERIDHAFATQPEIRDEVFGVVTDLYSETNDQARTTDLARRRLAAARAAFGADDRRVAPAEVMLAGVQIVYGEFDQAKALLDHVQAMLDRAGDDTSAERAHLLRWQGAYLQFTGSRTPWPDHPLRRAVQLMRDRYPDDDYLLEALMGVPGLACRAGYVDEATAAADELQRRALARYGPDTLFTAEAMSARGNLLMLAGRSEEAIPLLESAAAGYLKSTGGGNDVIAIQITLAQAHFAAGHLDTAQRMVDAAAARIARDHPGDPRLAARVRTYQAFTEKIRSGERPHCGG